MTKPSPRRGRPKPKKKGRRAKAAPKRYVRASAPRSRRRRPPPSTHEVLGLRCHVVEVHLLDDTLVLMDAQEGKRVELPVPALVGRDALDFIKKGDAVWLSVRRERRTKVVEGPS